MDVKITPLLICTVLLVASTASDKLAIEKTEAKFELALASYSN